MSTLKNKVQLIGNVGNTPEIKTLESGKKVAKFSIATNEFYKDSKGEKQQDTQWHNIVTWGKIAEIVEKYVGKGKEVAIEGKLTSRSYETEAGEKRYVTEVVANEILLLGSKNESTPINKIPIQEEEVKEKEKSTVKDNTNNKKEASNELKKPQQRRRNSTKKEVKKTA